VGFNVKEQRVSK